MKDIYNKLKWNPCFEILQVFSVIGDDIIVRERKGTLTHLSMKPNEVWKGLCIPEARQIVISHSHPHNSTTFSIEDINFYKQFKLIAANLDFQLKDFLIKCKDSFHSIHQSKQFNYIDEEINRTIKDMRKSIGGA